jgi:hypothetical protein
VDAEHAAFMADAQVAVGSWRDRRGGRRAGLEVTAELVAHRHRRPHHPPDLQRFMSQRAGSTLVEIEGNHAIYVSNPTAVAELIQTAVTELRSAS